MGGAEGGGDGFGREGGVTVGEGGRATVVVVVVVVVGRGRSVLVGVCLVDVAIFVGGLVDGDGVVGGEGVLDDGEGWVDVGEGVADVEEHGEEEEDVDEELESAIRRPLDRGSLRLIGHV